MKGATHLPQVENHRSGIPNPRSREGSDAAPSISAPSEHISIHAPVKGATRGLPAVVGLVDISIHAPVKGATIGPDCTGGQPMISIHAPVKGATSVN